VSGLAGARARRRTARARRLVAALFLCLSAGGLSAACSAGRESLGTSDAPCYVALPTATKAVGPAAHLLGVRLFKVGSVPYRLLGEALDTAGVTSGRVCLVAFSGTFSAGSVEHPAGRRTGKLAVVILRYPSGTLIATVLFHHLPTRFGHSHLGVL
jgi:hypothetical protein